MKKIIFILLVCLCSCNNYKTTDDVRQVKKGISTNELKYLMGEPEKVEVNSNSEVWTFYYDSGGKYLNGLVVTIVDKKVLDFYSY